MKTMTLGSLVCAGVLAFGETAEAQVRPWSDRGFVIINGAYQTTTTEFRDSVRFVEFVEEGSFESDYEVKTGVLLDVAGAVRIWRNLAVGGGLTRFARRSEAGVRARIPHPFFFNQHRETSGDVSGIKREELAVHVQAVWVVPASDSLRIALFGGPSFFNVKQGLVRGLRYRHEYPYDTAAFSAADTAEQSESKVGINAGADVAYFFTRTVGVGGVIRFSRASVDFKSADGDTLTVEAGGLQAGGGLRLRF